MSAARSTSMSARSHGAKAPTRPGSGAGSRWSTSPPRERPVPWAVRPGRGPDASPRSDRTGASGPDLAAVRPVGGPDGGSGVTAQAEAPLVDGGVVSFAEGGRVVAARRPAVGPVDHVVDVAPGGRSRAAWEDAVPVAQFDRPADRRGRGALGAAGVQR